MSINQHEKFMRLALAESKKAIPLCFPNPPVGCVLVKDGVVVSSGYTQEPGKNHAEAQALSRYTGPLDDVSAYVTLEPCSFHGRTPSCAQAFIERNIGDVYVAIQDPDLRNSGRGIAQLRDAGINITENIMSETVFEFLSPYLKNN